MMCRFVSLVPVSLSLYDNSYLSYYLSPSASLTPNFFLATLYHHDVEMLTMWSSVCKFFYPSIPFYLHLGLRSHLLTDQSLSTPSLTIRSRCSIFGFLGFRAVWFSSYPIARFTALGGHYGCFSVEPPSLLQKLEILFSALTRYLHIFKIAQPSFIEFQF